MTEQQAWTIFVCEPVIFTLMLVLIILLYDKLFPCHQGERKQDTGRAPSMPTGINAKPKTRPYRHSAEMLDETDE